MRWIGIALIAAVALIACNADDAPGSRSLTGVVTEVDARTITDVRGFTLKSGDEFFEIAIDPDEDYSFPPQHLRAHAISGEPVEVEVRTEGDALIATSIEDAQA